MYIESNHYKSITWNNSKLQEEQEPKQLQKHQHYPYQLQQLRL